MSHEDQSCISDVEEANFIKKLQKEYGKYKGKLPFKCFNYGRIEHFANKCPISSSRIMMMKNPTTRKTNTRRNFIRKRKTSTPKKTSSLQT